MTVLDLFAGPGGWDVSADMLGLDVVGIELDADACATRAAAGLKTVCADVAGYRFGGDRLTGLIASPPCQTFSLSSADRARDPDVAGLLDLFEHIYRCTYGWTAPTFDADPRSMLVLEPLRYAIELTPDWIALEQVPPVLPIWDAMARTLESLGWKCHVGILNAADFGVSQKRRRAFLIGHRRGGISLPEPTHRDGGGV